MALLLHLIRQEEMDIFDINIQQITKQYLESMKMMKKLNLEGAGDFIAMAATLIQIKSRMLLPQYNEAGEVVETEDPRRDLVRRLIEYQMYQDAGRDLYQRPLLNRDVWTRGEQDQEVQAPEDVDIILEEENALYSLIKAYRTAVKSMNKAVHKVGQSLQSIRDRIWELRDRLIMGHQARFFELIEAGAYSADRKGQKLITFLSLLELGKMGFISLFQAENFEDIHIDTLRVIDRDVISQVENYDAANSLGDPSTLIDQGDDVNMAQEVADETARDEAEAKAQAGFDLAHVQMVSSEIAASDLLPILDPVIDGEANVIPTESMDAFDMAEGLTGEQSDMIEQFDSISDGSDGVSVDDIQIRDENVTGEIATDEDILLEEMKMAEEDRLNGELDNGEEI